MTEVDTGTDRIREAAALRPSHFVIPDVLTANECDWLLWQVREREPISPRTPWHPTFTELPEGARGGPVAAVQRALEQCNSDWGLPQWSWHVTVSSYTAGNYFPQHRDHDPTFPSYSPGITFAASVLLSVPYNFAGGQVTIDGTRVPKAQGTAACFHAFAPHSVDPVTSGERVALNVFATVGTLGEAKRAGWPTRWLYAREAPEAK